MWVGVQRVCDVGVMYHVSVHVLVLAWDKLITNKKYNEGNMSTGKKIIGFPINGFEVTLLLVTQLCCDCSKRVPRQPFAETHSRLLVLCETVGSGCVQARSCSLKLNTHYSINVACQVVLAKHIQLMKAHVA